MNAVGDHTFVHMFYTPPDAFYDVQLDLMEAARGCEKVVKFKESGKTEIIGALTPLAKVICN